MDQSARVCSKKNLHLTFKWISCWLHVICLRYEQVLLCIVVASMARFVERAENILCAKPCTGLGTGHSSPGCFRSSAFHVIVHRRPSARCPPAKLILPAAVLQPLMLCEPRWQEETVPRFFPPHGKIMCCMTDQPEKIGRKVSLLLLARHCWPFLMREQDSPGVEWCYIEPSSLIGQ